MMGVEKQKIPTSSRKATASELVTERLMAFHQVRLMAYQGDEMQEQGFSEEKEWAICLGESKQLSSLEFWDVSKDRKIS